MGPDDPAPGGAAGSESGWSRFRPAVAGTSYTSSGSTGAEASIQPGTASVEGPTSSSPVTPEAISPEPITPEPISPGPVSPGPTSTTGGGDAGWAQRVLSRINDPEEVLGLGKTPHQVVTALSELSRAHPERAVMATKLAPEAIAAIKDKLPEAEVGSQAGIAVLGPLPPAYGRVLVLTGGIADRTTAAEAAVSARVHGAEVERIDDVSVTGLHHLLAVHDRLEAADCVVAVAGMEGSLPSVIGGLTGTPVVAVPTSTGYGVTAGGTAALHAMLASRAPGVVVVNIDNGFGAGVHAARVARLAARAATG